MSAAPFPFPPRREPPPRCCARLDRCPGALTNGAPPPPEWPTSLHSIWPPRPPPACSTSSTTSRSSNGSCSDTRDRQSVAASRRRIPVPRRRRPGVRPVTEVGVPHRGWIVQRPHWLEHQSDPKGKHDDDRADRQPRFQPRFPCGPVAAAHAVTPPQRGGPDQATPTDLRPRGPSFAGPNPAGTTHRPGPPCPASGPHTAGGTPPHGNTAPARVRHHRRTPRRPSLTHLTGGSRDQQPETSPWVAIAPKDPGIRTRSPARPDAGRGDDDECFSAPSTVLPAGRAGFVPLLRVT